VREEGGLTIDWAEELLSTLEVARWRLNPSGLAPISSVCLLPLHKPFTNGNDTSAAVPTLFGNLAANLSSLVFNFLQLCRNSAVTWILSRLGFDLAALIGLAGTASADMLRGPGSLAAGQPALHPTADPLIVD